jgi:hypothetical protein
MFWFWLLVLFVLFACLLGARGGGRQAAAGGGKAEIERARAREKRENGVTGSVATTIKVLVRKAANATRVLLGASACTLA